MRRKERRGGIERKILTSILWVGITPITIALIVGYAVVHESQRKAVEHTLETAAEKTAIGMRLALQSQLRTVRTLSRDPEIAGALQPVAEQSPEKLEALRKRLTLEGESAEDGPSVYSLFDANARLVLTTGDLPQEDSVHNRWIRTIDEPAFISFRESVEHKRFTARIVAPVFTPDTSERIGFVTEDQGVTSLLSFALAPDLYKKSGSLGTDVYQLVYVSESGALATYLDPKQSPALRLETVDPRLEKKLTEPEASGAGVTTLNRYKTRETSVNVLLAYHRAYSRQGIYTLNVVVYRPKAAVFSVINHWASLSMLGSALVIGLFCLIAYRNVHNNIVRPVALLNEGAQIIRQGDLDLKLKIGTGDEIEQLAASFNQMALALKRNISQVEDSEEKYRSLVTSMREGVYQTDTNGVISFLNPAGAEIFGYAHVEDAFGQNISTLFLDEADFKRMSDKLAEHSFVERTRIWMKRIDGREICLELSGNRVLDDEARLVGTEGIFRDVTAGVRLEQEARERSERIAAINQIANAINSSLEAGRVHESLVVEVKRLVNFDFAAVALLDEQGETFEWRQLWPEQDIGPVSHPAKKPQESCAAWVAHNRKYLLVDDLHKENSPFVAEFPEGAGSCLCVPLYAAGRIIGTLNLGAMATSAFYKHDIEVLEQMAPHVAVAMRNARLLENLQLSLEEVTLAREKLHQANEQLKTLDEMKTNLLSNVSHELRTPLVAVMGYADMLYNGKVGPVNEVQAEYLSIILRNVEKLVTLIENLLDFSRLHRGADRLVFDTFDIVDCARTSIQIVRPVADSREIEIELDISSEVILVEGDKGKIGQVFNNLLSNAVKFNHNGGRAAVSIRLHEGFVEVEVSDTGVGIPPEALDKVFTRFYQLDSSSTRKYGGTGIGLAIAQDIVRFHGGRISVTSEVGKGSTFRFSLPLTVAQAEEGAEGLPALPLPPETRLVLELVTQDRALSAQVRDLLASENIDVIQAACPDIAIALATKYSPDCIVVDMEPVRQDDARGGQTALDELLAEEVAAGIPIVILTNDDDVYEQYRSSVAWRVKRSFRQSTLLSGIRLALSQSVTVGEPLGDKILCVDDDPEVLTFVTRCLAPEGYRVDCCSSGRETLEHLASREYALVLLDIAMPGLDGWEVCRRIKSDASLTGIKVYLVTAKYVDRSAQQIQEVGADGYLLKPFKPQELVELVHGMVPVTASEDS